MSLQRLSAILFYLAASVFLFVGLRGDPRQTAFIVLGVVVLVLGGARLRRMPVG